MKRSDSIADLMAALARAQGQFQEIPKTKTARVRTKAGAEYTYTYADIGDLLKHARPILSSEGIAVMQLTRIVHQPGGAAQEFALEVETVLTKGAEWLSETLMMPLGMVGDARELGTASTYLRRYGLAAMIGIATDADTDANGAGGGAAAQARGRVRSRDLEEAGAPKAVGGMTPEQRLESQLIDMEACFDDCGALPEIAEKFARCEAQLKKVRGALQLTLEQYRAALTRVVAAKTKREAAITTPK